METLVLGTIHVAIWLNLYFGAVWKETVEKSKISNPAKFMFRAWLFFSGLAFLMSIVVLIGNGFFFLKRW